MHQKTHVRVLDLAIYIFYGDDSGDSGDSGDMVHECVYVSCVWPHWGGEIQ